MVTFSGMALLSAFPLSATEPLSVRFLSGGAALSGKFFPAAAGGPCPALLLNPGFPGGPDDVLGLGAALSGMGIHVLMFNPRGMHASEGNFSFPGTLQDIDAALNFLRGDGLPAGYRIDPDRVVLGGHSFGGGMSLAYAATHSEIRRIVSVAGTDHGEIVRKYRKSPEFKRGFEEMIKSVQSPGGPARFEFRTALQELIDGVGAYDLRLAAPALADRDILILGGWEDDDTMVDDYLLPFYRALKKNGAEKVTFIVYHTDHGFRNVRDRLARDIARWVKRD